MKAAEILSRAADLVSGDRDRQHGEKVRNFEAIASVWNGILRSAGKLHVPLDGHDVGNLMEGMKIARRYQGEFNPDDYIDGCGYSACAGEVRASMEDILKELADATR